MNKEIRNILRNSTILLVEDDERIKEKFSRLLSIYVNKIYEASSGSMALKLYKKYNPSFIITDIEMSDMNGLEFLNILRKEDQQIPVIVISAYSNKEYLLDSIKLQIIAYLLKPIDQSELFESLKRVALILRKSIISNNVILNNEVSYDPIQKTINIPPEVKHLTSYESKLLELLIINRGNIVTKNIVEDQLYIFKEMSDAALKNIIYKLRKKLGKDLIISVNKLGYLIQ